MVASQSPLGKCLLQPFLLSGPTYTLGPGEGTGLSQSALEPACFSLDSLNTEPGAKLPEDFIGNQHGNLGKESVCCLNN